MRTSWETMGFGVQKKSTWICWTVMSSIFPLANLPFFFPDIYWKYVDFLGVGEGHPGIPLAINPRDSSEWSEMADGVWNQQPVEHCPRLLEQALHYWYLWLVQVCPSLEWLIHLIRIVGRHPISLQSVYDGLKSQVINYKPNQSFTPWILTYPVWNPQVQQCPRASCSFLPSWRSCWASATGNRYLGDSAGGQNLWLS